MFFSIIVTHSQSFILNLVERNCASFLNSFLSTTKIKVGQKKVWLSFVCYQFTPTYLCLKISYKDQKKKKKLSILVILSRVVEIGIEKAVIRGKCLFNKLLELDLVKSTNFIVSKHEFSCIFHHRSKYNSRVASGVSNTHRQSVLSFRDTRKWNAKC